MAYDSARSQLVIFGTGYGPNEFPTGVAQSASATSETWTWRTGKWTKLVPATSPPPRLRAGMAYDDARRQIVLFGGESQGLFLQDTWTWDGRTWSQSNPVTSPPAGARPGLVYHSKLGRVIALVGSTGGIAQTWAWDGKTWAEIASLENVGPEFGWNAAYDLAHESVVVLDRDTWTFDGVSWARHAAVAAGPRLRFGAAMAYDPSTRTIVMFGGGDARLAGHILGDTWTWDGTGWTQARPTNSPGVRSQAIAATDLAGGQVVLYGGATYSQHFGLNYSDTWTWAHGSWSLVQPITIPAPPGEQDAILAAAALGPGLRSICAGPSAPCMSVRGRPQLGFYAAYVVFDLNPAQGKNALCTSYVSFVTEGSRMFAAGPWHQVGVVCSPSDGGVLQLGSHAQVHVTGCANVRTFPAAGEVVRCLRNGTAATIDDGPIAIVGDTKRLWWHLQQHGWIANELLAAGGGA